jgi:hypothetical protein
MLLDDFLPQFDFNEVHIISMHASRERVFRALTDLTPAEIALVRTLFAIRSLPARLLGKGGMGFSATQPFLQQALRSGFTLLAESPNQELVLGTIGQFWKLTGSAPIRLAEPAEFLNFHHPDYAKAAMNFSLEERSEASSINVRTETRILVPDPATRKKFARYWRVIYPGSALIRRMWLRAIKRRAEQGQI